MLSILKKKTFSIPWRGYYGKDAEKNAAGANSIVDLDEQYMVAQAELLYRLKRHFLKLLLAVYLDTLNFDEGKKNKFKKHFKNKNNKQLAAELDKVFQAKSDDLPSQLKLSAEDNKKLQRAHNKIVNFKSFITLIEQSEGAIKTTFNQNDEYSSRASCQPALVANSSRFGTTKLKPEHERIPAIQTEIKDRLKKVNNSFPLFSRFDPHYSKAKAYLNQYQQVHKQVRKEYKRRHWYFATNEMIGQMLDTANNGLPANILNKTTPGKITKARNWIYNKAPQRLKFSWLKPEDGKTIREQLQELQNLKGHHDKLIEDGNKVSEKLETKGDALKYHKKVNNLAKNINKLILEEAGLTDDQKADLKTKTATFAKSSKRWLDPYYKHPKRMSISEKIRYGLKIASMGWAALCGIATIVLMFTFPPAALVAGLAGLIGIYPVVDMIYEAAKCLAHGRSLDKSQIIGLSIILPVVFGIFSVVALPFVPPFIAVAAGALHTYKEVTGLSINSAATVANTLAPTLQSKNSIINKVKSLFRSKDKYALTLDKAEKQIKGKRLQDIVAANGYKTHDNMFVFEKKVPKNDVTLTPSSTSSGATSLTVPATPAPATTGSSGTTAIVSPSLSILRTTADGDTSATSTVNTETVATDTTVATVTAPRLAISPSINNSKEIRTNANKGRVIRTKASLRREIFKCNPFAWSIWSTGLFTNPSQVTDGYKRGLRAAQIAYFELDPTVNVDDRLDKLNEIQTKIINRPSNCSERENQKLDELKELVEKEIKTINKLTGFQEVSANGTKAIRQRAESDATTNEVKVVMCA